MGREIQTGCQVCRQENLLVGRQDYLSDDPENTHSNAKHDVVIEDLAQIGSHCSIHSISIVDGKQGPVVLKKNCCTGRRIKVKGIKER